MKFKEGRRRAQTPWILHLDPPVQSTSLFERAFRVTMASIKKNSALYKTLCEIKMLWTSAVLSNKFI